MLGISAFLIIATLFLAYSNGANDNFKGVATLYGSGVVGYGPALRLGTGATLAGSVAALFSGSALAMSFSGKGLVPDWLVSDPSFLGAVGFGAAGTVLLATRLGFPISTTHALVGAMLGAGAVRAGADVNLSRLTGAFVAPLLLSPIAALALASAQYPMLSFVRRRMGLERETCVCVGEEAVPVGASGGTLVAVRAATVAVDSAHSCKERFGEPLVGVEAGGVLDGLHWLSAAAVSFARGLNDTPKIAALLLAAQLVAPRQGMLLVGVAIALGGLVSARRVAETMGHGITSMSPGQALVGNITTAFLVLGASRFGAPVSTTHVSVGALVGVGAATGQAHWATIKRILAAWVITLPTGAAIAAAAAFLSV